MLAWPDKDPDEVLDFQVDWTDALEGDTLSGSTFSLVTAAGLTIDGQHNDETTSTVWLSGGTANLMAELLCRVTTAAARTMDETIKLRIRKR